MKTCNKCKNEFEGKYCVECRKAYYASYYLVNATKMKATATAWQRVNPDKMRAKSAAWAKANPDRVKANNAAYYLVNPDKAKAASAVYYLANSDKAKAYSAVWAKAHPDKMSANTAIHRAKEAAPKWLTEAHYDEMLAFYTQAKQLELFDGEERHVDHIVPLQGKTVSGLHVPWNLQILTASENISKGNKS